jgi:hypothetical protein
MNINDAPIQILSPDLPRKKWHQRWSVRIPAGLALLALAGSIGAAAAGGSHLAPAAVARAAPSASASASPAQSSPDFNQTYNSPSAPATHTAPAMHAPAATRAPATHAPAVVPAAAPAAGPSTCHLRDGGQLPDPRCTPGATAPRVTQATIYSTICVRGYTATVRPPSSVTTRFKYDVSWPEYGVPSYDHGELDHLIPLELGGSSAAANLWPEIGPLPNPKDSVENALNHAVCSDRVSLRAAQRAIAADWLTAESVLGIGSSPAPYHAAAPHRTTAPRPAASQPATAAAGRYRAGEYCSVHGSHTTDSHGRLLTCAYKNGWRWEH